jgi:hypothetical protein
MYTLVIGNSLSGSIFLFRRMKIFPTTESARFSFKLDAAQFAAQCKTFGDCDVEGYLINEQLLGSDSHRKVVIQSLGSRQPQPNRGGKEPIPPNPPGRESEAKPVGEKAEASGVGKQRKLNSTAKNSTVDAQTVPDSPIRRRLRLPNEGFDDLDAPMREEGAARDPNDGYITQQDDLTCEEPVQKSLPRAPLVRDASPPPVRVEPKRTLLRPKAATPGLRVSNDVPPAGLPQEAAPPPDSPQVSTAKNSSLHQTTLKLRKRPRGYDPVRDAYKSLHELEALEQALMHDGEECQRGSLAEAQDANVSHPHPPQPIGEGTTWAEPGDSVINVEPPNETFEAPQVPQEIQPAKSGVSALMAAVSSVSTDDFHKLGSAQRFSSAAEKWVDSPRPHNPFASSNSVGAPLAPPSFSHQQSSGLDPRWMQAPSSLSGSQMPLPDFTTPLPTSRFRQPPPRVGSTNAAYGMSQGPYQSILEAEPEVKSRKEPQDGNGYRPFSFRALVAEQLKQARQLIRRPHVADPRTTTPQQQSGQYQSAAIVQPPDFHSTGFPGVGGDPPLSATQLGVPPFIQAQQQQPFSGAPVMHAAFQHSKAAGGPHGSAHVVELVGDNSFCDTAPYGQTMFEGQWPNSSPSHPGPQFQPSYPVFRSNPPWDHVYRPPPQQHVYAAQLPYGYPNAGPQPHPQAPRWPPTTASPYSNMAFRPMSAADCAPYSHGNSHLPPPAAYAYSQREEYEPFQP